MGFVIMQIRKVLLNYGAKSDTITIIFGFGLICFALARQAGYLFTS
ncbi:hypothetical protein XBJ2_2050041 [Xenorhabdus bovienii str. Jollieti]|uniref:Uncharacterized protein n=7 Tax=Xenorhabdus bovienii TaxID=40576 RepID=A0A077PEI4_XENBV|nr:hypothetical protein XBFFR1_130043 [Xenorhabdus bovienii str. feltiae France]CDG95203.1 hypothetical protein XBP1_110042 [Xenorhabdus bovienii str. puntauvense]CDH03483.1 hypothetical protein XBFM1_80042 [Xenorhabdus bovienii str. feltiae Moldova]CDH19593.1 hypothetical protein XBKQ1_220042 [Xenorhabdus bovienii str. kraussei Quebec]CDH25174.1 hypothetical protein XBKB1_380011 [Xenorhabdus bovienii str. kraussei Becker Underwood]CDH28893.1 hypothetical protein XBJ2_2050041 [Xenorhabdus bovi